MIIAHRGWSSAAPENTAAAIIKALDLGVDAIEVDVQQSRDGILILMHDDNLKRTTSGTGRIKKSTFSELKKQDAGSWFSREYAGEKIPSLEESLILIAGKARLFIEIKRGRDYYPDIEANVIRLINKHNAKKWCVIKSFRDEILKTAGDIDAGIETCKLVKGNVPLLPFHIDMNFKIGSILQYKKTNSISICHKTIKPGTVAKIKQRGQQVLAWTVNEKADMKKMIAAGVDGIITDYPERLKEVLEER